MKSIFSVLFLSSIMLLFLNCSGTGAASSSSTDITQENAFSTINDPDMAISLADHLRKVAGVQVSGSGPNATVTIRGISSINSGTEPLFVVNGITLAGGYRAAHETIPVHNIKSIRVLKSPADTGLYGVRGANGVIEIWLK